MRRTVCEFHLRSAQFVLLTSPAQIPRPNTALRQTRFAISLPLRHRLVPLCGAIALEYTVVDPIPQARRRGRGEAARGGGRASSGEVDQLQAARGGVSWALVVGSRWESPARLQVWRLPRSAGGDAAFIGLGCVQRWWGGGGGTRSAVRSRSRVVLSCTCNTFLHHLCLRLRISCVLAARGRFLLPLFASCRLAGSSLPHHQGLNS